MLNSVKYFLLTRSKKMLYVSVYFLVSEIQNYRQLINIGNYITIFRTPCLASVFRLIFYFTRKLKVRNFRS